MNKKAVKISIKSLFAALIMLGTVQLQQIHLLSLASSIYNVFVFPLSTSAKTKNLLGSYVIAITVGICFSLLKNIDFVIQIPGYLFIVGSFAIGLMIFISSLFNLEHPPAAGIALGFVYTSWNYFTPLILMIAISELAIIKKLFIKIKIFR